METPALNPRVMDVIFSIFIENGCFNLPGACIEWGSPERMFAVSDIEFIEHSMTFDFAITEEMEGRWIRVAFKWVVDNECGSYYEATFLDFDHEGD